MRGIEGRSRLEGMPSELGSRSDSRAESREAQAAAQLTVICDRAKLFHVERRGRGGGQQAARTCGAAGIS